MKVYTGKHINMALKERYDERKFCEPRLNMNDPDRKRAYEENMKRIRKEFKNETDKS